jgi:hypothetical protein
MNKNFEFLVALERDKYCKAERKEEEREEPI